MTMRIGVLLLVALGTGGLSWVGEGVFGCAEETFVFDSLLQATTESVRPTTKR